MAELTLDEDEKKKLDEWNKEHLEKFHEGKEPYAGAIGGRITFHFTYTSIGEIVSVHCAFCPDDKCTLTDFKLW